MPAFGLGTWMMGWRYERDRSNNDERDILAIKKSIELGITHIDTAELYAGGYVETLIAQAIRDIDRSKIFLASKVKSRSLFDSWL